MTGNFKNFINVGVISAGLFALVFCLAQVARAESWSWAGGTPVIDSKNDADPKAIGYDAACPTVDDKEIIVKDGTNDRPPDCLIGKTEQFKLYTYYNSSSNHGLAIQFKGDTYATRILGITCPSSCTYLSSTGDFAMIPVQPYWMGPVHFYKNFVAKLKLQVTTGWNNQTARDYVFEQSVPDKVIVAGDSDYSGYVKRFIRSDNDKWLLLESSAGLLRYDITSGKLVRFSNWRAYYGPGVVVAPVFTISEDGQHVASMGYNAEQAIYDITTDCGDVLPIRLTPDETNVALQNPCPKQSLLIDDGVNNPYTPYLNSTGSPQFSSDGGELSFYAGSRHTDIPTRFIQMHAAGYKARQLDYLALGDSYSSGEGDTAKDLSGKKYYREFTDTETERCHLSTRSYPYLLAKGMNLSINTQWNSVACSGATTKDVYEKDKILSYKGQDGRLVGKDADALKYQALNEFIPGRAQQIEFVKKYRPKVITLTMGGNDIGFSEKLNGCVANLDTCGIVTSERGSLKNIILEQYSNLTSLYTDLYKASGSQSKIYVLGYPNFINDYNTAVCSVNVGALNMDERVLIKNSITFLNSVIEQAAKAAGVKYIDTEDSLIGHRLCDAGDKHVTGISDPSDRLRNLQESFHPNAAGQVDMATSIEQKLGTTNLIDYKICPDSSTNNCPDSNATKELIDIPQYFKDVETINSYHQHMTQYDQVINSAIDIATGMFSFADSAVVSVVLHSDPVSLGEFTATPDGSLNMSVALPSTVSPGIHTLILSGKSRSGDSIQYEQTILVKSSNPNDVDGDGILDSQDKCLFVPTSNIDQDKDGVDDGCDSEISALTPTPIPPNTPLPSQSPNPILEMIKQTVNFVLKSIKAAIGILSHLFQR